MGRMFIALASLLLAMPAAAQPAAPASAPAPAPAAPVTASAGAPLSFEEAVRSGQRAAESIVIAQAEVDRANAGVTAARAGYLPTVNGSAAYQRTLATQFDNISFGPPMMEPTEDEGIDGLPFGQRNNWTIGVQASQPLFDGFRTRNAVKQARAGVRASQLGVKSTRAQVVLQVAQAYFNAALAQRQVEIAEVTLQQAEQTLAETTLGFKQGATPEFDVVRAEVARDNQRTLIARFLAERDVAFVQLRRLIGVPIDRPLALTTQLESDDVATVMATARAAAGIEEVSRVAIAQAKESVAAREAAVDLAKADRLPVIAAVTDLGFVNYETHPFNDNWFTNWTLGVTLTVPIFDGFRRRAQIATSRAELTGARAQLSQVSEVSQVEAAQAAAGVTASTTRLETTARTAQQARRAYQIAELRFQQGASTHLELVDARVQLEQAQLNHAQAARDLRVARLIQELLPGLPLGAVAAF